MSKPHQVLEVEYINPLEDPFDVLVMQFEVDQVREALAFYDALIWSPYRAFWGVTYHEGWASRYHRVYGEGEYPRLGDAQHPMKYLKLPRPITKFGR